MNRITIVLILFLVGCSTVPLTNRKQLNLIPSSQVLALSADNYQQVLREKDLSGNSEYVSRVRRVGQNIARSVEAYLSETGQSGLLNGYNWEFNVIEDELVNAWAMPGGKIAFYEGIMPVCNDDLGVAVVMGHEVAHAVARHGNERMSQGLMTQLGGVALAVALKDQPQTTQAIALAAFGAGTTVGVILPFSRLHESEADELGLYFMAKAGYDPREAPKFWERMAEQGGGSEPPEFLSTHPNHSTRIRRLNEHMPKALEYYRANR